MSRARLASGKMSLMLETKVLLRRGILVVKVVAMVVLLKGLNLFKRVTWALTVEPKLIPTRACAHAAVILGLRR
jgi:hypothetical protein